MGIILGLFARAAAKAVFILAVAAACAAFLYTDVTAPGPLLAPRTLVIGKHLGLSGVARLLAQAGVIRDPLSFELAAILDGRARRLEAGEYAFPARTETLQAIAIIASGKVVEHPLTIPEGLTSEEVARLVRAAPELAGALSKAPKEGAVLPQTYFYTYGQSRKALIARMRRAMAQALAAAWSKRRQGLPLSSPRELLILASLVEKEAKKPEEKAHIAAVFLNRLKLGMPLQSDPTVIYALSDDGRKAFDPPLTRADLAVESPYNTYREKGLPPGPIDNPGSAALLAAARPAPSEDLYFVADGDGGHVFSRSLEGQDKNVSLYRRIEATKAAKASFLAARKAAAAASAR